jgi:hypothetical protein
MGYYVIIRGYYYLRNWTIVKSHLVNQCLSIKYLMPCNTSWVQQMVVS